MSQTYKWADFVAEVRNHFPTDSPRLNVGTPAPGRSKSFLELQIRQGVIDVQQYVEHYKVGHETVYRPSDFAQEGYASRATLPPQAEPNDGYLVKIDGIETASRWPLIPFDWKHRMALVHGVEVVNDRQARFCVDPHGYTFYVYPAVRDCWQVSINWTGIKMDFEEEEETPFDEPLVGCVAEYVKGMIARDVNKDMDTFNSIMRPVTGTYIQKRRNLFLMGQDRKGKF